MLKLGTDRAACSFPSGNQAKRTLRDLTADQSHLSFSMPFKFKPKFTSEYKLATLPGLHCPAGRNSAEHDECGPAVLFRAWTHGRNTRPSGLEAGDCAGGRPLTIARLGFKPVPARLAEDVSLAPCELRNG